MKLYVMEPSGRVLSQECGTAFWSDQKRCFKTNNAIKEGHQSFSSLLLVDHHIIWKFIDGLKFEQVKNENEIEKCIAGFASPPVRKSYKPQHQNFFIVISDFENTKLVDYLRSNFNFTV